MNHFDEQLRLREEKDQELFEDSMFSIAASILGAYGADALRNERIITKAAIDIVLKYYHYKPVDIPETVRTPEDQLDYALRPHGIQYRVVRLSGRWYRDAFGPMLAYRAEDGLPVVLLPRKLGGYSWQDSSGKIVVANKKTAACLLPEALCFYRPLPLRKLNVASLFRFMRDCLNWSDYGILIGLTLAVTWVGMLSPRITKLLSSFVVESGNERILWSTAVFLLSVLISSQLLKTLRTLAVSRLQIKVALPMEAAMMMRLMSLPAPFFRQFSAGELASRSGAINKLSTLMIGGVVSTLLTAVASLMYIPQIFSFAPQLGLPALGITLALTTATLFLGFRKLKQEREAMKGAAEESGVSFAILSGIQKIKLSGAEKRAFARWARVYARNAEVAFNPPLLLKVQSAVKLAIPLLGTILLYDVAIENGIPASDYLAFAAAYGTLTGAFTAFANITTEAAQIKPILEMAEPILTAEPEAADGKAAVAELSGGIELCNVSFRYQEKLPLILNGLSLKIQPGEYVAIVGKTGCGKSTLMRLLLGFEQTENGAIYYDGMDIRMLDLHSLRRKMGVVIQDGSLFSGDIFSNITVSAPQLTLEEAWEAADMAGIADDIRAMPMGMHTFITEGQGGLSGGQRQRLMIARAIAPKPKILLFDEATSALDNKTQKQVSDALAGLHCTRIVIAHRLSTVKSCDRIVVLENGRIAEEGSYDALLEKGGIFAQLVERQRIDH